MKRIGTCLLALMILAVLAVPARADLLWEPYGDNFFERHRDEMELVIRDFLANGEDGFVTLWDTPGGKKAVAQYENGKTLCVYNTYRDWGLITVWEETEPGGWHETYGWTPLADLSLVYDNISFQEEYADEIRPYRGEFSGYQGSLDQVNAYEYPGAPEAKAHPRLEDNRAENTGPGAAVIKQVFTDEEGLTWGHIPYYYGSNIWFCLDDPCGSGFPVRQVPVVEYTPPQAPAADYVPYILVGGVVAVTAGLLYWFYARQRSRKPTE